MQLRPCSLGIRDAAELLGDRESRRQAFVREPLVPGSAVDPAGDEQGEHPVQRLTGRGLVRAEQLRHQSLGFAQIPTSSAQRAPAAKTHAQRAALTKLLATSLSPVEMALGLREP